jgi:hypothetical protein
MQSGISLLLGAILFSWQACTDLTTLGCPANRHQAAFALVLKPPIFARKGLIFKDEFRRFHMPFDGYPAQVHDARSHHRLPRFQSLRCMM